MSANGGSSVHAIRVKLAERGRTALLWLHTEVLWKQLGRTTLALLPLVVDYYFTGNPVALQSNLILVSLYIGAARINYGLPGLLLHAFVILAAFGTLLFAQQFPVLFAILATLLATSAVLLGRFRENWRTFGSFYLIPSVYMAMELYEQNHGMHLWSVFLAVTRCSAIGFGFLVFFLWVWWKVDGRTDDFFTSFGLPESPNPNWRVMTLSVLIAEAFATAIIAVAQLPNAQWMVWSVVSVVTGDSAAARDKFRSRVSGGLIGVSCGFVAAFFVPHVVAGVSVLTVVAALTLVGFRHYPFAFGSRCFFITLAAAIGDSVRHSEVIGLERVANVLLGGTLGFSVLLLVESIYRRRATKS